MAKLYKPRGLIVKSPCGCVNDDGRWLEICDQHRTEADAIHARWAEESKARPWPADRNEEESLL